jgi:transposase
MVFLDESGFMLQPTVRRTWGPRGQTPVHYSWDRRDRLSVISALTLSPRRRRLGLYFQWFKHNIKTNQAEAFVAALLGHFPQGIILVWDRWMVHRAAARRLQKRFPRRVDIEWLPAYAPELNPTEQVWNHSKYADLANFIPRDLRHLVRSLVRSLRHTRACPSLLRSFFQFAKLSW